MADGTNLNQGAWQGDDGTGTKENLNQGAWQGWYSDVVGGQLLMNPGMDGLGSFQFDNAMNGGFNA